MKTLRIGMAVRPAAGDPAVLLVLLGTPVVVLSAVLLAPAGALAASFGLGLGLLALAASDLRRLLLPDVITLPLAVLGLLAAWPLGQEALAARAIGLAVGFASFWAVAAAYRRWRGREGLGGGDAKLLAAAGAWVGWQGLPSVVLLGAVAALAMVLLLPAWRRDAGTRPIPFGSFLAAAAWWVWLVGPLDLPA